MYERYDFSFFPVKIDKYFVLQFQSQNNSSFKLCVFLSFIISIWYDKDKITGKLDKGLISILCKECKKVPTMFK